jgi:hypothetical protein
MRQRSDHVCGVMTGSRCINARNGALIASWFARDPGKGVRLGLIGVVVTTLAMAWVSDSFASRLEGALWRAAVGAGEIEQGPGIFDPGALFCQA